MIESERKIPHLYTVRFETTGDLSFTLAAISSRALPIFVLVGSDHVEFVDNESKGRA